MRRLLLLGVLACAGCTREPRLPQVVQEPPLPTTCAAATRERIMMQAYVCKHGCSREDAERLMNVSDLENQLCKAEQATADAAERAAADRAAQCALGKLPCGSDEYPGTTEYPGASRVDVTRPGADHP